MTVSKAPPGTGPGQAAGLARRAVLQGAPDPADALRRFERVAQAQPDGEAALDRVDEDAHAVLALCCQRAPYLATLLARDPGRLGRIAQDGYLRREKPAWVMARELAELTSALEPDDDDGLAEALRHYRADEMVRLGSKELGLGSRIEVGAELAHLADVCLDAAISHHRRQLTDRYGEPRYIDDDGSERTAELVVIGMGKLGGEELNFASDIDIIYVYSSDNGEAGDLSIHEWMSKLCERVTTSLSEVTVDDTVFRVDLRLRPEGSRGAIANSLPSLERYYESWGRPWERQAWLKARPCAGDLALGDEVMRTLEPFVYPRHTSPRAIEEVTELNRRIKSELVRSNIELGFDVKNGVGGIREIEFFAQALQLIHAPRHPSLRTRSTLAALEQLVFAGIIPDSERHALAEAYGYLRHIEHLLQLDTGRQTQRLPADPADLGLFASRLGHRDAAELLRVLGEHTRTVADLFATLGEDETGPPDLVVALLAGDHDQADEERMLAELGFLDPKGGHQHLERARRNARTPFGRAAEGAGARVAPHLLSDVIESPNPDQALIHVCDLASRRGAWSSIWRLMDESPQLRRLLVSLFGTSEYLSRHFLDHPELIDTLIDVGKVNSQIDYASLNQAATLLLNQIPSDDDEERWNALTDLKNAQILRIALADIAGELAADEVCLELSTVAEVCLQRAYALVESALVERHGHPRHADGSPATLAVLCMGKLGGRELGYASDLDVVFVYSDEGDSDGPRPLANVEYMSRLAQRMMSGLHTRHAAGRLYELDTRLRPSGSQGLLVSSLSAWRRYHRESAQVWEQQALTRLRPIAGDLVLGSEAERVAHECIYGDAPGHGSRPDVDTLAGEMRAMRQRIERELAVGSDLKVGRGGLVDIEFASQFIRLVLGWRHAALRTPSTLATLRKAAELDPALAEPATLLADAYLFLRRLEHRIRIVHDAPAHRIPDDPVERDALARRMDLTDGEAFTDQYQHWTAEVRKAYDEVLDWRPDPV